MKIRYKLLCALTVLFFVGIVSVTLYTQRRESRQHLEAEITSWLKIGQGMVRTWNSIMLYTGSDNLARDQFFNQKNEHELISIGLKRNKKLTRINRESSPYVSTELEKRVVADGHPAFELLLEDTQEERRLLTLVPLKAKPACVGCHQDVNNHNIEEGEVMAVISLVTSLKAVDAQVADDETTTVFTLMGFFVITLLISYVVINRLTRPIINLTQASEEIAVGHFDVHVPITSKDELGALGKAFNLMAQRVKESRDELEAYSKQLEKKVGERTRELEVQKAYLEQLLENAPEAIIVLDEQDRILRANTEFTRMFGYPLEETLGRKIDDLIVPDGDEKIATSLSKKIKEGKDVSIETVRRRKNGTTLDVSILATPIRVNGGNIAVYTIYRDITERKRAEEELHEAKEAAEAANVAKSEFLANMSHEIRTPMNGIIGFSDLLADEDISQDQMEYVEIIRGSAESLLTIINDILDFSKIEAGKLDLEFIDFDLRTTIEELADLFAIKAEEKGLSFSCFLHPQVEGFVNGDPGRLKQILINLANNAVKFTKQGEIAIRGELKHETESEICVRFSVTDTGIGIPKKAQQNLFQSFTQVDASTTRKFGGTGLGLTISKQLAEMMGGEIGIESPSTQFILSEAEGLRTGPSTELRTGPSTGLRTGPSTGLRTSSEGFTLSHVEGKGSTFWFTVLLKKQPKENRQRQFKDIDLTGKRILVIDDNQTNRDILRLQLQSWHCIVEEAGDATEALKRLHQQVEDKAPFAIAFVDMQMPGMDGETLGKIIKNEAAIKETILIMLTSIGRRGDARRMSEIGFEAYLTKPLKQSQLYDCLVTLLNNGTKKVGRKQLVTRHTIAEDRKLNLKILLAEDNLVNQKVATKMLQKLGCQVDLAANGKEAVEMVQNSPYDLLFMDCQMPELDGFEATTEIRRAESENIPQIPPRGGTKGGLPIIAMTANAMQGDRERCLEVGMDDYISKPINAKKLLKAIHKWTKPRVNVVEDIEAHLPTWAG